MTEVKCMQAFKYIFHYLVGLYKEHYPKIAFFFNLIQPIWRVAQVLL